MAKRSQRFIDEASAQSLVRYGPELSVLRQLMSEASSSYRQKVHSAQAGAAGIQAAVAAARPQLEAIYPDAVGGIPGLSRVQALNDLVGRGVRAQESAAGARRTALQELASDRAKLAGRRTDIAQEIGAFTTATAGTLGEKASERDLRNRISLRSDTTRREEGRKNRQNARTIAKIRTKPKSQSASAAKDFEAKYGVKKATTDAHRALVRSINNESDRVADLVRKAKSDGKKRSEVDHVLRVGIKGVKSRGEGGFVETSPDVKPVSALERGIILDLIYDGHVSNRHSAVLHSQGYSVKELGLPGRRGRRNGTTYVRTNPRVA